MPPLPEQTPSLHILGALDDKIELNDRTKATLQEIAQVLFRSWFVSFDPVRAKLAGRSTNLPNDLSELFPAALVDSELGQVPEGWEVVSLDEMARF